MSETSFFKLYIAAMIAGMVTMRPIMRQSRDIKQKIDELKPKIQTCDVIGEKQPEKFYEIDGKRVYLEIDGKPINEYFAKRKIK